MIKKLTQIGNSYGLVIDKSILELLKISAETELELSTDGVRLIIEPLHAKDKPGKQGLPKTGKPRISPPSMGIPKKQPW